jgi:putative ATP-dependent endonuclease of the OLD family
MKLLQMSVQRFRCIAGDKTTISFHDSGIIFIFGQNDAGKPSMLSVYREYW